VKTLKLRRADFEQAIDMAPAIKPHRHTFLHEEIYCTHAKKILAEDEILRELLV
jgi:glycerol-1-phosphate dehydrogenase [NAD(P)+]